jgi:hypothetical protein
MTREQARQKEREFFSSKEPWASEQELMGDRLGCDNLQLRLSELLADICRRQAKLVYLLVR